MKPARLLTSSTCALLPWAAALSLWGATTASAADYPGTVLADNPVGYYRFEEPLGTTNLTDSSVSGVPASIYYTLNATNPTLGQLGIQSNSVNFNGTTPAGSTAGHYGTIDIPFRQELAPTNVYGITTANGYLRGGPFSIECWTRSFVNRTDGKYEGIVA
ncbi:MAG TPA: hypothetical protein VNT26_15205, partial [Candidatus Sulfotelmatobacter sp.]|nr:hypothetical protein [Candidatus Sulfotelmatobacter sp.]